MNPMQSKLKASDDPLADLQLITYEGQDPSLRMYRSGYENYFNQMPALLDGDPLLDAKVKYSRSVMDGLADKLLMEDWVRNDDIPAPGKFNRTILAMERPKREMPVAVEPEDIPQFKEGHEFVLARWGDGFSSPVHGHTAGYLHEQLLFGKMLVNMYQLVSKDSNVVRPLYTRLFNGRRELAFQYSKADPTAKFKRQAQIHSFTSIGYSATLHYLAEHTRDGRDNGFKVEYFEDWFKLQDNMMRRITGMQAHYARPGDVILVRSTNVKEYGVHWIVVTGAPVMKDHGLRIQDEVIQVSQSNTFTDKYPKDEQLVLLKLDEEAAWAFRKFHRIRLNEGRVTLPDIQ